MSKTRSRTRRRKDGMMCRRRRIITRKISRTMMGTRLMITVIPAVFSLLSW